MFSPEINVQVTVVWVSGVAWPKQENEKLEFSSFKNYRVLKKEVKSHL